MNHTSQIHDTILEQWCPDTYKKFNYDPTTFKADNAFELTLEETLPATISE